MDNKKSYKNYELNKDPQVIQKFLDSVLPQAMSSGNEKLMEEEKVLTAKLKNLDHKISLINKNDPDYLDMLYRQKFNYVTEDEIIIKLK